MTSGRNDKTLNVVAFIVGMIIADLVARASRWGITKSTAIDGEYVINDPYALGQKITTESEWN